jgi:hypothetical protein
MAMPCPLLVNKVAKISLALAVSLALNPVKADSQRSQFRLALNEEISSRRDKSGTEFAGRVEVEGLIQSHPDPLYVQLEDRYQALPPFAQAAEDFPEKFIAQPSTREKLVNGVRALANNAPKFLPSISSSIRYDDIKRDDVLDTDPGKPDQVNSTAIALISPHFRYEHESRKWLLSANYDYNKGRYFIDRDSKIDDHTVQVNWTKRLNKGNEFAVRGLIEDSHERSTQDPIKDFDSATESEDLNYRRQLLNLRYKNGTPQDRTRYQVTAFGETSQLKGRDLFDSGYELERFGVSGKYAWKARKQLSLIAEAKVQILDYDQPFRDNDHLRALVGVDMVFNRRIRAILRAGYDGKRFKESQTDNTLHQPMWNGVLEWALRRKTTVRFETGREIFEAAANTKPVDTNQFNVRDWIKTAWHESWSNQFSTEASYTFSNTEAKNSDASDVAQQLLLKAVYQFSAKLKVALEGAYTEKSGDFSPDLNRRTVTFTGDYSL